MYNSGASAAYSGLGKSREKPYARRSGARAAIRVEMYFAQ
jgi:hypothetical protein